MVSTDGHRSSKLALRFFSNASIYGLGSVLVRFGSLVVLPFYWQVLTPEDFGVIAVAQIIPAFLGSIYDLGLSGSLQRHFFEWKEEERPKHIAAIWSFSLFFSFVMSLILTIIAPHLTGLFADSLKTEILWIGIWTAFLQNFGIVPFSLCRIREQLPLFSALSLAQFLIQTLSIVIFLFVFKMGHMGFIWGIFAGALIYAIGCLVFIRKEVQFPWKKQHLKEPLNYALPTFPSAVLEGMSFVLDRFFLQKFVPLGELGLYSLARQFAQAFHFFQSTLKNSWVPLVFRIVAERVDAPKVIGRMSSYYFIVLLIPATAIAVLSADVIYLINQPDYFGIAPYIPLFILGFLTYGLGNIFGRGIDLAKKMQYYWIVYLANFASNLGLLALWAPKYGAWGAISAFLVSGVIREILQIGMAFYFYPRPIEWRPILGSILLQGLGFLVCQQVQLESHWLSLFARGAIVSLTSVLSLMTVVKFQYWSTGEWKKLLTKVE